MDFDRLGMAIVASLVIVGIITSLGVMLSGLYKMLNEHCAETISVVFVFVLLCTFFYRKVL